MAKKVIRIELSAQSIAAARQQMEDYKAWLAERTRELCTKLAEMGAETARPMFESASFYHFWILEKKDGKVTWGGEPVKALIDYVRQEPTEQGSRIVAKGHDVCFVEFGAGVWSGYGYPGERPPGIADIGTLGLGLGSNKTWSFDYGGQKRMTRGNSPHAPMFYASHEIQSRIGEIAREVFTQ